MQALYSFNLVDVEIHDFHIGLSRFCIATRVMALCRGLHLLCLLKEGDYVFT